MRKVLYGLALLAPLPLTAQTTPYRGQSGFDVGPVINCVALDGSGAARCLVPSVALLDANGVPLGTAANPVFVSGGGSGGGGNTTDVQGTGTLAAATVGSTYVIPLTAGRSSVGTRVSGLTASGATVVVERTNDGGTTWTSANTTESSATGSLSSTLTADGQPRIGAAGATAIRFRVTVAGTGTISIAYNATAGTGPIFMVGYLPGRVTPDGTTIGGVDNRWINGTAISTGTGTMDAGTQRVAIASNNTVNTSSTTTNGALAANQPTIAIANGTTAPNNGIMSMVADFSTGNTVNMRSFNPNNNQSGMRMLATGAFGYVINSAGNYDPWHDAVSPNGTTGAGLAGAGILGRYQSAPTALTTGQFGTVNMDPTTFALYDTPAPSATAFAGIAGVTVQGATVNILKASPGNLYSINVVNSTAAGFIVVYNATAAPASGTALAAANTPYCMPVAASQGFDKTFVVPSYLSAGVTLLFSTSCTTYTPVATAPITLSGQAK